MKRLVLFLLLMAGSCWGQTVLPNFQSFCELGGKPVVLSGLTSASLWQQSFPACTITVYTHGVVSPLPVIYRDAAGTQPLSNPFTADAFTSYYQFYAVAGRYDVTESGNLPAPFTWADVQLNIGGGGGGGGLPCGITNDVQLNLNLTTFGCDTGVFVADPVAHSVTDNIVVARQEVDVSDPTHSGLIDMGHSNGATVDSHYVQTPSSTFSTANGGYGIFPPDAEPTALNQVAAVSSLTPTVIDGIRVFPFQWLSQVAGLVNYENLIPLWTSNCPLPGAPCNDLISTQIPWFQSTFYRGPLAPTQPNSAWVQDKIGLVESVGDVAVTFDNPIIPGDSVYAVGFISCGLGCSGQNFTIADSIAGGGSNIYTDISHSDGGGDSKPMLASYSSAVKGGITTVTFHPLSPGPSYETIFQIFELRGSITPDVYAYNSPVSFPPITFLALTTTTSPDTIIATAFANTTANAFTAGTGYKMLSQSFGTYSTLGSEITNKATTGTYTPTMTNSGSGSAFSGVYDVAFHITLPTSTADPVPGFIYYNDLVQGGDFPVLSGQAGKPLVANAAENGLAFGSFPASGVSSIQPENNGTPYGSAQTGAITMNFANCTVSATFTITCPSGTGTVNSGAATHLGYYAGTGTAISDMGADFTFNTHTLAMGASGILDLHSGATSGFLLSGSFSTGFLTVATTTGAVGSVATSGIKCYPYGGSGGTGCDTPSGSGLSGVVMPSAEFASSITSGVETVTKQNQAVGTYWKAPSQGGFTTPFARGNTCYFGVGGPAFSCPLTEATAHGDTVLVHFQSASDSGSSACVGGNNGNSTIVGVADAVNGAYSQINAYNNPGTDVTASYYVKNVQGGLVTPVVTFSGAGSTGTCLGVNVMRVSGVDTTSPLDAHSYGLEGFSTITTTNPNDIVIVSVLEYYNTASFTGVSGQITAIPATNNSTGYFSAAMAQYYDVNVTGAYQPIINGGVSYWVSTTTSFKAASLSGSYGPPNFNSIASSDIPALLKLNFSPVTFSALDAAPAAGEQQFCSDCKVTTAATCSTASPSSCVCANSGTGAIAKYINYVSNGLNWYCQ